MLDLTITSLVIYVQVGIVTLGHLVYRHLAEIHRELAIQRGRTEIAIQDLDALIEKVDERVSTLERLSRRVRPGHRLQVGRLDLRASALEIAGRGGSAGEIASALKLRRPEAELLLKLQQLAPKDAGQEIARFR